MRRGVWVLVAVMVAQVLVFGGLGIAAGGHMRNAGNPVLYFLYWFQEAAMHGAPMIAVALAMTLTAARGTADLSLAGVAAVLMGVMAWCPKDQRFWTIGLAATLGCAVVMGLVNAAAVKRVRLHPLVITAVLAVVWRAAAMAVTWKNSEAGMLLVPGFDYLESFRWALPVLIAMAVVVDGLVRVVRGAWTAEVMAAVLVFVAACLYTAQDRAIGPWAMMGAEVEALAAVSLGLAAAARWPGVVGLVAALNMAVLSEGMRGVVARWAGSEAAVAGMYGVLVVLILVCGVKAKRA